jgi:hypothetical protein
MVGVLGGGVDSVVSLWDDEVAVHAVHWIGVGIEGSESVQSGVSLQR